MAFLLGMSECVKGRKFDIVKDSISIGRSGDNDIVIEHETISSKHCLVERNEDVYTLRDLDSTNGTMVNTRLTTETRLNPKDVVQFGAVEFVFDGEELKSQTGKIDSSTAIVDTDDETPAGPPQSFSSVSPFGTRKRQNKNFWIIALVIVGALSLAGLGFFLFKLLF